MMRIEIEFNSEIEGLANQVEKIITTVRGFPLTERNQLTEKEKTAFNVYRAAIHKLLNMTGDELIKFAETEREAPSCH